MSLNDFTDLFLQEVERKKVGSTYERRSTAIRSDSRYLWPDSSDSINNRCHGWSLCDGLSANHVDLDYWRTPNAIYYILGSTGGRDTPDRRGETTLSWVDVVSSRSQKQSPKDIIVRIEGGCQIFSRIGTTGYSLQIVAPRQISSIVLRYQRDDRKGGLLYRLVRTLLLYVVLQVARNGGAVTGYAALYAREIVLSISGQELYVPDFEIPGSSEDTPVIRSVQSHTSIVATSARGPFFRVCQLSVSFICVHFEQRLPCFRSQPGSAFRFASVRSSLTALANSEFSFFDYGVRSPHPFY